MSRRVRCSDGKRAGFVTAKLHISRIFARLFSTHFQELCLFLTFIYHTPVYSDLRIRLFALSTTEVSKEAR